MELIDVVDEQGNKTGEVLEKKLAHKLGKWHIAAHVWIYNSKGELMLQQRSLIKDTFPGLWDISVAGHISAGESPETGAIREVEEEIGLKVDLEDIQYLFTQKESHFHPDKDWYNNEFHFVYLCKYDGKLEDLKLQSDEVDSLKFICPDDLMKDLQDEEQSKNYVGHPDYYHKIINEVKSRVDC